MLINTFWDSTSEIPCSGTRRKWVGEVKDKLPSQSKGTGFLVGWQQHKPSLKIFSYGIIYIKWYRIYLPSLHTYEGKWKWVFYSYTLDFIRGGDNVSNKSFWKTLQLRSQQLVREDVVEGGRFILPTLFWRTELIEVTQREGQREASTPLRNPPNRAAQQWIYSLWVRATASVQGGKTALKNWSLHLLTV